MPDELQEWTVDDLKDQAKALGIEGYSSLRKDDLIVAIHAAEDDLEEDAPPRRRRSWW